MTSFMLMLDLIPKQDQRVNACLFDPLGSSYSTPELLINAGLEQLLISYSAEKMIPDLEDELFP